MNKIIISLLLLLASISLVMLITSISFSQVNTVYHDGTDCNCDSIHQVYDDNGKLASEAPYVNGKLKRIEKLYFTDGTECECDSITQVYVDIGLRETPYVNGKKNGVENAYHKDGSLLSTAKYKNGVLDGYKHCSDGRMGNESLNCAL